jgi:hypothetical protein
LLPETGLVMRHLDRAVHTLQRGMARVATPAGRCLSIRISPGLEFRIQTSTNHRGRCFTVWPHILS